MELFGFTRKQKQKVREHELTHFCPRCMRGYQREEKPLSEESENCPYCGEELIFLRHKGKLLNVLWCEKCKKAFTVEGETLKKIEEYMEKTHERETEEVE